MPKISIITTTYNHQDFIAETIESIIDQSYTDWELLIGDDSPNDATRKIIQKYVHKYPEKIRAWHHFPNKGIVDNMNFLLEKINSESAYVAFLEGDDLFIENNLEKKIQIFTEYKEVGMVYNNFDFIDSDSKIFKKNFFSSIDRLLKNEKLRLQDFVVGDGFYGSYSTLMIRKDILREIGIHKMNNDKMYLTSDWNLFGSIANLYPIYGISKSVTLYRIHENNSSGNNAKLTGDLILGIKKFIAEGQLENTWAVRYKISHLNMYKHYLGKHRVKTLQYGLQSFTYSLTKNFTERVGMILFSLLPKTVDNYLYKKFKQ